MSVVDCGFIYFKKRNFAEVVLQMLLFSLAWSACKQLLIEEKWPNNIPNGNTENQTTNKKKVKKVRVFILEQNNSY